MLITQVTGHTADGALVSHCHSSAFTDEGILHGWLGTRPGRRIACWLDVRRSIDVPVGPRPTLEQRLRSAILNEAQNTIRLVSWDWPPADELPVTLFSPEDARPGQHEAVVQVSLSRIDETADYQAVLAGSRAARLKEGDDARDRGSVSRELEDAVAAARSLPPAAGQSFPFEFQAADVETLGVAHLRKQTGPDTFIATLYVAGRAPARGQRLSRWVQTRTARWHSTLGTVLEIAPAE